MSSDISSSAYEMAHVLFVDIVEYSLQPIDRQTELLNLLQRLVRETAEFRRAREKNELISLPTGDGMALVFQRDPLSPARCALDISAALPRHPELKVRMGIHTGPVQLHADIREHVNVVGAGINIAQRVMDSGDAGHILLSQSVADVLEQLTEWRGCLQDLGVHEVKHGVKLHLYSLSKDALGNREVPHKFAHEPASPTAAQVQMSGGERTSLRTELVRRGALFAVVFVVACVLAVTSEWWLDNALASRESTGPAVGVALMFSGFYQRMVAAPRRPIPRYTVVVEIDPERDPGSVTLYDRCRQRRMLAALLRRVAEGIPSVIVIDKYFGTTECPGNINADLTAAMSEVSVRVPIVVGRLIDNGHDYLEPSLLAVTAHLRDAIVNIDPDPRKLPLEWDVFPNKEAAQRKQGQQWHDTLSLAGARAYERGRLEERHPRLAELLQPPPRHPYISFLDVNQFRPYTFLAGYILCGREVKTGEDATACAAAPEALAPLSGKVVLIGDISSLDRHLSVVGEIPGIYMQANFIEALLDDRYYEDSRTLNFVLGFIFLAALEAILLVFRNSWVKKLGAVGILMIVLFLLLYELITDFHRYVNPLPFIALALLIRGLAVSLPYFRGRARSAPAA